MQKNVGSADKAIRILIGLVLLSVLILRQDSWRWIGLLAVIPFGTAIMGWCPLYTLFGFRTCSAPSQS